ncbi:hypothetical protein TI03_04175 [Achromatium sp. WMS1]|nr:hypothetical protein TI03_04175 [Achromatium sp. WMS1]
MAESIIDLTRALNDADPKIRQNAAQRIGFHGASMSAAIPALTKALQDTNSTVRHAATWALGQMGSEAALAVPILLQTLVDSASEVRLAAIISLGKIGPKANTAIPGLLTALADQSNEVRQAVSQSVHQIDPVIAADIPILLHLLSPSSTKIHPNSLQLNSIQNLIELLTNTNATTRQQAVLALGQARATVAIPHIILLLKDTDFSVRWAAVMTLEQIGEPALLPMLTTLPTSDWYSRWLLARPLRAIGGTAITALINSITATSANTRTAATWILGHIGQEAVAAIPALSINLLDADSELHRASIWTLSQIGLPAIDHLNNMLLHARPKGRIAAAKALNLLITGIKTKHTNEIDNKIVDTIVALIKNFEHQQQAVRQTVAHTLGRIGKQATPLLLKALSRKSFKIRQAAAEALGIMGHEASIAIPTLIQVASCKNFQVRKAAIQALGYIGGTKAQAAIPELCKAMQDVEPQVREAAIIAINAIKIDVADINLFIQALGDKNTQVRTAAAQFLGTMDNKIIPHLLEIIVNSSIKETRMAAFAALARMGKNAVTALPTLLQALTHEDAEIREAATHAIGKMGSDVTVNAILPLIIRSLNRLNILYAKKRR